MRFRQISLVWAAVLTLTGSAVLPAYGMTGAYETETGNSYTEQYQGEGSSPVSMEVSYGYEENAKSGRYVPVSVTLNSQSEVSFTGTLRITAMESDYDIYEYDYPVSLNPSGSLEESLDIPVGRADVLYVKLLDSQGRELLRKRLKMNVSLDTAELFVGVLSDNPQELDYMEGVGVNYSSVRIKTFEMDTEKMPDNAIGLDLLDVLVITDYDTRNLTGDQVSSVWEWVKGGGTLLIGTGARADDTLYAFRSSLLEEPYAPPAQKAVDMGVEYAVNGPGDSFMNLVCTNVTLSGGTEVLSNDEFPVLTSVVKGKGSVGVAAYDFIDIAEFCRVQRSYVDKLFTAFLGENRLNNLSSYLYSGNSSQYWSVQNILNTGDTEKLPNLSIYAVVILGYLVIAGPGLYLFLKRREQRTFYRMAVVGVSLTFTAVVYLMGGKTRFKDTFFNYATILDTTEDYVDEYTSINIRTPYNKAYTISLDPSYNLLPITRSNTYEGTPVPKFTGNEDYKVRVFYGEDETKISVQNASAFDPKYYSLRKRTPNTDKKGLAGDITLFEGKVYGTITNEYPFPVERVGILMYGKLVAIDALEPGQTMELDGFPVVNYPVNSPFLVSARVTGSYQYPKADIEDPAYMLALSRTNILSFYLDRFSSFYNQEARVVAFGRDKTENRFLARGDYETYGMSMFTSTIDVKTTRDGKVSRSALMKPPTAVNGQYYADSNAIYGIDPVSLEYSLGNDLEVEELFFENPSEEFLNSEGLYFTNVFKGSIHFYNHDTGNYDVMNPDKKVYHGRELTPYLSPGNTLTVKYVCDSTSENNWYVTLPMLSVTGRNK
ncbi:hypothetical protein [Lacrimispora sp.]|uniref:hypothetical protein n=1 Tax=Lacrimispora sp. TaxID=2719234 RepID=UPI0034603CD7